MNQTLSGTLYTNGASHFTLTVPEGWKANDNLVEPRSGVGALTAPDGEANLVIQFMLTTDSPETPMISKLVLVPKEYGFLVFDFVTLESLFDKELPTFDKIISSYRSTEPDGTKAKIN